VEILEEEDMTISTSKETTTFGHQIKLELVIIILNWPIMEKEEAITTIKKEQIKIVTTVESLGIKLHTVDSGNRRM